jgi:hypothetical protein
LSNVHNRIGYPGGGTQRINNFGFTIAGGSRTRYGFTKKPLKWAAQKLIYYSLQRMNSQSKLLARNALSRTPSSRLLVILFRPWQDDFVLTWYRLVIVWQAKTSLEL